MIFLALALALSGSGRGKQSKMRATAKESRNDVEPTTNECPPEHTGEDKHENKGAASDGSA